MGDKLPDTSPIERIPAALAAHEYLLQAIVTKLLENGALRPENIRQIAEAAPAGDAGSLVRVLLEPFKIR